MLSSCICTISENMVFEKWNIITSLELNQIISQRMTRQIKSFHNEWRGKSIIYNFINEWWGEAESWVYEIINDWFAKSRVMKGFRFAKSWVVNWFDLTKDEWWYFISQKSHFQKFHFNFYRRSWTIETFVLELPWNSLTIFQKLWAKISQIIENIY